MYQSDFRLYQEERKVKIKDIVDYGIIAIVVVVCILAIIYMPCP